jgi:hypothetical protein
MENFQQPDIYKKPCKGDCGGVGKVSVSPEATNPKHNSYSAVTVGSRHLIVKNFCCFDDKYYNDWERVEVDNQTSSGIHTMDCADCGGTGKEN